MTNQRCGNCRYFKTHYEDHRSSGICKRYPPTLFREVDSEQYEYLDSHHPEVAHGDWCGEHAFVVDEYGVEKDE